MVKRVGVSRNSKHATKKSHMKTKGQAAMEYLVIFSFAFFLTLPLIIIYSVQSSQLQIDVVNAQLFQATTDIVDSAEEVFFLGEPSQKTIYTTFPRGIESVSINNTLIIFNISDNARTYEYVAESRVPLSGEIRAFRGLHVITLTNENGVVNITDR